MNIFEFMSDSPILTFFIVCGIVEIFRVIFGG